MSIAAAAPVIHDLTFAVWTKPKQRRETDGMKPGVFSID